MKTRWLRHSGLLAIAGALVACSQVGYQARFTKPTQPAALDRGADFLKCHMRNWKVAVLSQWTVEGPTVVGFGRLYDADRKLVPLDGGKTEGRMAIALADVALFETNRPETIPRSPAGYVVLGIVTVGSVALTAYCASNPKACFGSCPTFYTAAEDGHLGLQAEGFSSSVARPLEDTDVDAMLTARPHGRALDVVMTNEALETHLVDSVRILAAPRKPGMRVYRAGSAYFEARPAAAPVACRAKSGDCLAAVQGIDASAYSSPADADDLSARETIDLAFARPNDDSALGIVIAARNTLLNTFVFYQGLAYLGRDAGDWFARAETEAPGEGSPAMEALKNFGRRLGGIEVAVEDGDGGWKTVGEYSEVGPLAREAQMVPIGRPANPGEIRVRLTMAKGNFRLDHVGLAELGGRVEPFAVEPVDVLHHGRSDDGARTSLKPGGTHLVTYPGDAYTLRFELPVDDPELFLESRGYYYEWMRQEWYADQSALEIARIMLDPAGAMRTLAPRYKRVESQMEGLFWNSRVAVQW